jgi:GT2 family glycosyltransferase
VFDVDVVVVSFNSARFLRRCVAPLVDVEGVHVVVVDNASSDDSPAAVADLPVRLIGNPRNLGFAAGCNQGWRTGTAPYVLFLNPDAVLEEASLRRLVSAAESDPSIAVLGPRIEAPDGTIAWSQRRFPRLRTTYARALFLYRLFPHSPWADEVVRDPPAYLVPRFPDWVSGACMLVRRSALDEVGGWDEAFFLYCEDIDLCRRMRDRGYVVSFEPSALAVHEGGASAPSGATLPRLTSSRVRYAYKHHGGLVPALERLGLGLEAATRMVATRGGMAPRVGQARALRRAFAPLRG